MSGSNVNASDDFIRRMETELQEKTAFANEIIARAESGGGRDLTEEEKGYLADTRGQIERIKSQLEEVESYTRSAYETVQRQRQIAKATDSLRQSTRMMVSGEEIMYRSAGEYMLDAYKSHMGNRESTERIDMFLRAGAAHVTTGDNLGVVPDPIVGPVVNFIDAARPIVSALGPRPMPSATWHRPLVTQSTTVGAQGTTGAADKEKSELVSQKMTITRLNGTAVTYGGYVNVSRQLIDFSQPAVFDAIINDLAAQYAIETEAAVGAALAANNNASEATYDLAPSSGTAQDSVAKAVWSAAALAYTAVKGQGRLILAVAPDVLSVFGPIFQPYGIFQQQGQGFLAGNFGQGQMGTVSGITTVMSAGIGTGEAYLFSTAAIEVYEQRVGTLQITEPSVLGVQVAYAGYFTPLPILANGVVPLVAGSL